MDELIVLLIIVLLIIIWFWVFVLLDRIIKYHHDNYYENWLSEGQPRGLFYVPENAKKIYSGISFYSYASKLRKELPNWAKEEDFAKKLIMRFFFWEKVWIISIIIAIPTIILVSFN